MVAPKPGGSRPRPDPRRADRQDPYGLRRNRTSPGLCDHGGSATAHACVRSWRSSAFPAPASASRVPALTTWWPPRGTAPSAIRHCLRRRGNGDTIPERADQIAARARRGSRGGWPPAFDREIYKRRNMIERCFYRLKQFRASATRYDKTVILFTAVVTIARILLWL